MESLDRMLANAKLFPIELTLTSGDRVQIPHPDYAHRHPVTKDLLVYPQTGPFLLTINPAQIAKIEANGAATA
jgi:hypothetical protein